jgi:hypothetical protein
MQECLNAGSLTWRENDLAAAVGATVLWMVEEVLRSGVKIDPDVDRDGRVGDEGAGYFSGERGMGGDQVRETEVR